jgi:hypothetical protein
MATGNEYFAPGIASFFKSKNKPTEKGGKVVNQNTPKTADKQAAGNWWDYKSAQKSWTETNVPAPPPAQEEAQSPPSQKLKQSPIVARGPEYIEEQPNAGSEYSSRSYTPSVTQETYHGKGFYDWSSEAAFKNALAAMGAGAAESNYDSIYGAQTVNPVAKMAETFMKERSNIASQNNQAWMNNQYQAATTVPHDQYTMKESWNDGKKSDGYTENELGLLSSGQIELEKGQLEELGKVPGAIVTGNGAVHYRGAKKNKIINEILARTGIPPETK